MAEALDSVTRHVWVRAGGYRTPYYTSKAVVCVMCIYAFSALGRQTDEQSDRYRQGTFGTNRVCTMTMAQVYLRPPRRLNQFGDDLTSVADRQFQRPRHPSEPGKAPGRPMAWARWGRGHYPMPSAA
jgi:hypothetical protein